MDRLVTTSPRFVFDTECLLLFFAALLSLFFPGCSVNKSLIACIDNGAVHRFLCYGSTCNKAEVFRVLIAKGKKLFVKRLVLEDSDLYRLEKLEEVVSRMWRVRS